MRSVPILWACALALVATSQLLAADMRNVKNGHDIALPGLKYADQPYLVALDDGSWLCIMTVGTLGENTVGTKNESVAFRSTDQGKTWSKFVPCNVPYAIPLRAAGGRVYAITTEFLSYSDDRGATWSERFRIPACPPQGGWNVGMPLVHQGVVYVPWAEWNNGTRTVVHFYRSDNLLTERTVDRIRWEMFGELRGPDWDKGRQVSEEPHLVALSDGTFYCVFRTDQGYICQTSSPDQGKTWTAPRRLTYEPNGTQVIKHTRACPSLWKCSNGKYLLWHHNNGTTHWYERNPGWVSGGVERDGQILWSQPEVLLYADDIAELPGRISYPGFLEQGGRYWIAETSKTRAGLHEIEEKLLQQVWTQHERRAVTRAGLKVELEAEALAQKSVTCRFPTIPDMIRKQGGFSIDLWLEFADFAPGQVILDNRDRQGRGVLLHVNQDGDLEFAMGDSRVTNVWCSDRGVLHPRQRHHVVISVDGGPKIIRYIIDGHFCDGGADRPFGWGRISPFFEGPNNGEELKVAGSFRGRIESLRLYNRALTTSEAVGNFRAGLPAGAP